jgi:hypothetical protein
MWQAKMNCGKLFKVFSHIVLAQDDLTLNYCVEIYILLGFGDGFFD